MMNKWIDIIANNDNEIGKIYRDDREYIIEINYWNGDIKCLKTVNCQKITHNIEFTDDIGSITFDNGTYKFMTIDEDEIILEIVADVIVIMEAGGNGILNKKYLKLIGMECLYMLAVIVIACIANMIQFIGRNYMNHYSGIIFSGDIYQYNFLSYICGALLFIITLFKLYRIILNNHVIRLNDYKTISKIIFWIISVLLSFGMFLVIIAEMFLLLGLRDYMKPDVMSIMTVYGWPFITAIFMSVVTILNGKKVV